MTMILMLTMMMKMTLTTIEAYTPQHMHMCTARRWNDGCDKVHWHGNGRHRRCRQLSWHHHRCQQRPVCRHLCASRTQYYMGCTPPTLSTATLTLSTAPTRATLSLWLMPPHATVGSARAASSWIHRQWRCSGPRAGKPAARTLSPSTPTSTTTSRHGTAR